MAALFQRKGCFASRENEWFKESRACSWMQKRVKRVEEFRSKFRNTTRQTNSKRECGRTSGVFNRRQEDGLELDEEKMGCWYNVRLTGQCHACK